MGPAKVTPFRPKTPGNQTDPSFATTLAHGLDVLAAFRNRAGALSNAELAVHTGLSRPTVSRPAAPLGESSGSAAASGASACHSAGFATR